MTPMPDPLPPLQLPPDPERWATTPLPVDLVAAATCLFAGTGAVGACCCACCLKPGPRLPLSGGLRAGTLPARRMAPGGKRAGAFPVRSSLMPPRTTGGPGGATRQPELQAPSPLGCGPGDEAALAVGLTRDASTAVGRDGGGNGGGLTAATPPSTNSSIRRPRSMHKARNFCTSDSSVLHFTSASSARRKASLPFSSFCCDLSSARCLAWRLRFSRCFTASMSPFALSSLAFNFSSKVKHRSSSWRRCALSLS